MRDVDPFKRCNDTLGHGAGNTRLNSMAQLRRSRTRARGIAARYGGEEFAPVMPQATRASTRVRAAQLRREVKQLQALYASRVRGPITLSLGVARCLPPGASAQSLRPAAARALDAAKHGGRDRVTVAPAI
jgi:diguanylate cyclase (GGDEF)-like protein